MQKQAVIIQDISCFGKCSASVALPIVSHFNIECALLPSALLSAHTGFDVYTCTDLTQQMQTTLDDWSKLGLSFDGFYSGYMLTDRQVDIALSLLESRMKSGSLVLVDPVMGDNGKPYSMITDEFCEKMRLLVSRADVITPNLTEAALLLNKEPLLKGYDKKYIEGCLFEFKRLGCKIPMITGVSFHENEIGVAFLHDDKVNYCFSEKHSGVSCGTGDTFASVLFACLLGGSSVEASAAKAVNATEQAIKHGVLKYGINFESILSSL